MDENIQVYSLRPYRMHSYKATKYLWNYFKILSLWLDLTAFLLKPPKVSFLCPWVGHNLQAALLGSRGRRFSQQLPESFRRPVYPPFAGQDASKSFTVIRVLPSLEYAYATIQFILQFLPGALTLGQFPPHVFIVGQIKLSIRDNQKGGSVCWRQGERICTQKPGYLLLGRIYHISQHLPQMINDM